MAGANIKIYAASSGSGKSTYFKVEGEGVVIGEETVENTVFTEKSYTVSSAGTVTVSAPSTQADGTTNNNNLRIQKILVTYE